MQRFSAQFGVPPWEYTLSMGNDEDDKSYLVSLRKYEDGNFINTVWFFDLSEDTRQYRTITLEK